jgi:hypothetical protein
MKAPVVVRPGRVLAYFTSVIDLLLIPDPTNALECSEHHPLPKTPRLTQWRLLILFVQRSTDFSQLVV